MAAVISFALVAMGEPLGIDMCGRMVDHLLQYGDKHIRRVVPLAIAIVHISDPEFSVVDTLSKLTHDADKETAQTAIIALGLVGAGTNHSRIAGLLRQLASFYAREAKLVFMVRIAQGILHMGKVGIRC